eukprot:scaffold81126_cov36-Phaeocystis_antarctica.AAC.1
MLTTYYLLLTTNYLLLTTYYLLHTGAGDAHAHREHEEGIHADVDQVGEGRHLGVGEGRHLQRRDSDSVHVTVTVSMWHGHAE